MGLVRGSTPRDTVHRIDLKKNLRGVQGETGGEYPLITP
uniref:Uncharacterized protein n=1 Tax=Pseudomonas phage KV2023 TaxID=3234047 RepID=A0AB39C6W4_9CAUD